MGRRGSDDALDIRITHHFPQSIGAEYENVTGLDIDLEVIEFKRGFLPQAAVNLVAFGVSIDIIATDRATLNQASDHGVITCDRHQSFGWAVAIGTTIADIHHMG